MRRAAAFAVLALIAMPRDGLITAAPASSVVDRPVPSDVEGPVPSFVEGPYEITQATVLAIKRWVAAVHGHAPGQRDDHVEMTSALTLDDRRLMSAGIQFFLSFLKGNPAPSKTEPEERLAHLARATMVIPGAKAFLRRAAVLHADTALMRQLDDVKSEGPAVPPVPESPYSALLSQRSLFINRDGEILGDTLSDWNWAFGRSLLALLAPRPADDPFVGTWYHATSAFMFQTGLWGEVLEHLRRAAAVLPDDARILFDRACYAELQGLPRIQVLLSDQDVAAARAQRSGRSSLIKVPAAPSLAFSIPAEDDTNDEAERLFRRAVRADPSFVEARVRLGRLLGLRKHHAEAASELATALAAKPTGSVLFYAHLFAGRSAQALGKIADAAGHYEAATLLFPGAQSAQLALSQAAVLDSDVPAALASIQRMDKSTTARDPWWWYHLAAGRDADALLRDMWTRTSR